jgi:hypothetical protein
LNRNVLRGDISNPVDVMSLHYLLARHPECEQKVGCGVESFLVGKDPWGTHCFHVRRTDGATASFSYTACLDGKGKSVAGQITDAMRYEVEDWIVRAKQDWFDSRADHKCELTGVPIGFNTCAVDHMEPWTFKVLSETFLLARRIAPDLSVIEPMAYGCRLADRWLAADWVRYHNSLAVVRIISRAAHKAETAKLKYPVGLKLEVPANENRGQVMARVLRLLAS